MCAERCVLRSLLEPPVFGEPGTDGEVVELVDEFDSDKNHDDESTHAMQSVEDLVAWFLVGR